MVLVEGFLPHRGLISALLHAEAALHSCILMQMLHMWAMQDRFPNNEHGCGMAAGLVSVLVSGLEVFSS